MKMIEKTQKEYIHPFDHYTNEIIELFKKMESSYAKKFTDLKKQVEHLESHLHDDMSETPKGFFCSVVFNNAVPPEKHTEYQKQFENELKSIFENYGVYEFEGIFTK